MKTKVNSATENVKELGSGLIDLSGAFKKYSEEREISHEAKATQKKMSINERLDNFFSIYQITPIYIDKPVVNITAPKENIYGDDEARDEICQNG